MTDDRKRKPAERDPRHPLNRLRHHVTGAIERGEAEAVAASDAERQQRSRAARKAAGGQSVTVMLPADAAAALWHLRNLTGKSATDVISDALLAAVWPPLDERPSPSALYAAWMRAKLAAEHPYPPADPE